jgi:hypothetical protein
VIYGAEDCLVEAWVDHEHDVVRHAVACGAFKSMDDSDGN